MTVENLEIIVCELKKNQDTETTQRAVSALGEFLYTNLTKYRLSIADEDTRSDFIVWLYPRFSKILEQFDPKKASLKTYLSWIVRLTFKTFCRERYGKEARQRVYINEEETRILSEMAEKANNGEWIGTLQEKTGHYGEPGEKPITTSKPLSLKQKEIQARQLLLLACKSGYNINDNHIENIARYTDMPEEYLRKKLDSVRQRCLLSLDRLRVLRERRYSFYLRAQKNLIEMEKVDTQTSRYAVLEREYHYCLKRIHDLKLQSEKIQAAPSNRFIASALGIPRGTVDSTLAGVRKHEYSFS